MTSDELTDAGWPRPIIAGWPVPWVSPSDNLAQMFVPRLQACASGAICAVCGLGYREAERAYVLVKDEEQHTSIPEGVMIQAMDNAVMHRRCLVLALGRCPKLLELRREGKLKVIRTWGNLATPTRHKSPSGLAAVLEAEDCELVDEF